MADALSKERIAELRANDVVTGHRVAVRSKWKHRGSRGGRGAVGVVTAAFLLLVTDKHNVPCIRIRFGNGPALHYTKTTFLREFTEVDHA